MISFIKNFMIELFSPAIIISLVALIITLSKWFKEKSFNRAQYVSELIDKLRDNYDKEVIYAIEYNEEWYSKEFHESGEKEKKFDDYLTFLSYICYLKNKKLIKNEEFEFFKYRINRATKNFQVQDYLFNIYHFSKNCGVKTSFNELIKYGKKNKLINEKFYSINEGIKALGYHENLNFKIIGKEH